MAGAFRFIHRSSARTVKKKRGAVTKLDDARSDRRKIDITRLDQIFLLRGRSQTVTWLLRSTRKNFFVMALTTTQSVLRSRLKIVQICNGSIEWSQRFAPRVQNFADFVKYYVRRRRLELVWLTSTTRYKKESLDFVFVREKIPQKIFKRHWQREL